MTIKIFKWFNKKYPQNYIIRNPYIGTLIFLGFIVFFVIIYKPLKLHESRFFSYGMTITVYNLIVAIPLFGIVKLLKHIRFFSNSNDWTILKEILSGIIVLLGMGIIIYFAGFLLEPPVNRWTLMTFLSSLLYAFLLGVVPYALFTIINYRYLFVTDIIKSFNPDINTLTPEKSEELVRIESQLKKEVLVFYPSQFIYAESDGNYIVFHLNSENQVKKRIIRNSISSIEQQLSPYPFLLRTHRAFIVNVKMVTSQKGNSLGYRLKLAGVDTEIPVSRQKTREFEQVMKRYH
jgi:hypothetical protein